MSTRTPRTDRTPTPPPAAYRTPHHAPDSLPLAILYADVLATVHRSLQTAARTLPALGPGPAAVPPGPAEVDELAGRAARMNMAALETCLDRWQAGTRRFHRAVRALDEFRDDHRAAGAPAYQRALRDRIDEVGAARAELEQLAGELTDCVVADMARHLSA